MKRKIVNCRITDQECGVAKTNKQCDRWFKKNDPGYEHFHSHTRMDRRRTYGFGAGMIWPFKRRKPWFEPATIGPSHVCVAVDSDGRKYTEHAFSFKDDDPWRGATILSQFMVNQLRDRGELPLQVVTTCGRAGTDD